MSNFYRKYFIGGDWPAIAGIANRLVTPINLVLPAKQALSLRELEGRA